MSRAWVLFVLVACGGTQAPPSRNPDEPVVDQDVPTTVAHRDIWGREVWAAARPEVDLDAMLPNLDEELRWPLASSSHPVLEPRYAIAAALAQPGVTWMDLCKRGIQNRHVSTAAGQEQQEYLRAWCSVANHDVPGAVAHLATLAHPIVLGLGAAVTLDFADILVEGCNADEATHLLTKNTISDPDVLDTLAATYLEVDRLDDAREINNWALQSNAREPARCHRLTREIALASPWQRPKLADDFVKLELGTTNATCQALTHTASCFANPAEKCAAYFVDQNIDHDYLDLFGAYYGWPHAATNFATWFKVANDAIEARGLPGADRLAVAALEAAFQVSLCVGSRLNDIVQLAERARAASHDPALDARFDNLALVRRVCGKRPSSK